MNLFADFLHQNVNDDIAASVFPQNLKNANIIRKIIETVKLIIGLSLFFRMYLNFMKDVSINKYQSFLIKYYPSTSAVSEKVLMRNTV